MLLGQMNTEHVNNNAFTSYMGVLQRQQALNIARFGCSDDAFIHRRNVPQRTAAKFSPRRFASQDDSFMG